MDFCAVTRSRHVCVAGCQTCGRGLFTPGPFVSPASTSASPLGKVTVLGYHLGPFIGGSLVQVLVVGSKVLAYERPTCEAAWPPATRSLPSARKAWPPQNGWEATPGAAGRPAVQGAPS